MSDVINRQCQECGGYEMDDGTSDICCCYEAVEDDVDQLCADLAAVQETARMQHEALQRRLNENSLIYAELEALHAELAAAKAEVESWNAQHERMNAAWAGKVERLKLDLSRHKRALELALYYVEGDATYEGVKEKVSRILEGGE